MTIHLHQGDLPDGLSLGPVVAIDTETMGLDPRRDRLCLVQISDGSGDEHLVRFAPGSSYAAPNLKAVLAAAGTDLDRVVKTTVFLADMNEFAAMNAVYEQHFTAPYPARSTVQVARLPRDVRVEIEVIVDLS